MTVATAVRRTVCDDLGRIRGRVVARPFRTTLQFRWECCECKQSPPWDSETSIKSALFDLEWHLDVECPERSAA